MKRLLSKKAITQTQAIIIIIIVIIAAIAGYVAYTYLQPKPPKQMSIKVWGWPGSTEPLEAAVPGFKEAYPELNVTFDFVAVADDEIDAKYLATIAAGTGAPDICVNNKPEFFIKQEAGSLLDITEWASEYEDDFISDVVKYVTDTEGHWFAFPMDTSSLIMYYRGDIFEAEGYDFPTTWDEYVSVGQALTIEGERYLAWIDTTTSTGLWSAWAELHGAHIVDENGLPSINTTEWKEATQFYYDLMYTYEIGYAVEAVTPEWFAALETGKLLSVFWPSWTAYFLTTSLPDMAGQWKAVLPPAFTEGDPRGALMGGSTLVISTQSENPYEAWLFIEYAMTTEDGAKAMWESVPGLFPMNKKAWELEFYDEYDEYFEQNYGTIVMESASSGFEAGYYQRISAEYPITYAEIEDILDLAWQKIVAQVMGVDEALDEAQANALAIGE